MTKQYFSAALFVLFLVISLSGTFHVSLAADNDATLASSKTLGFEQCSEFNFPLTLWCDNKKNTHHSGR